MQGLSTVKVLSVGFFLLASNLLGLHSIVAAQVLAPPPLIFTEIKVRNDTLGFNEYVEIYNPGSEAVSLNDYFIGYINTPAPLADQQFTEAVIAEGLLPAGQSLILASDEADPDLPNALALPFSSLSDSGGTLVITDKNDEIIDQFAWSNSQSLAIMPIHYLSDATATKSQSFTRAKDIDDNYLLTDPTWQLATTSPQSIELLPLPVPDVITEPDIPVVPDSAPANPDEAEGAPPIESPPAEEQAQLAPPQITEILPNPAPPATDSDDEYIELYNPSSQPLNLNGYKLRSGSNYTYSHTFGETILQPRSYQVFYVSETGNILSNTAGQVRLLDPRGVVVAQTNPYESADDGDAWALTNGAWQWTTTPTPDSENILTTPVLKVAAAKTEPAKKPKAAAKAAKPKTPAKKAAAAKTKAPKAAKAPKTAKPATERAVYKDPAAAEIAAIHPGILAGVGAATLVYAVYEYRHDAVNRLQQFRRYRGVRRAARAAVKG